MMKTIQAYCDMIDESTTVEEGDYPAVLPTDLAKSEFGRSTIVDPIQRVIAS